MSLIRCFDDDDVGIEECTCSKKPVDFFNSTYTGWMKFYNDDWILCRALLIKSNPMDEQEWTESECKLEVVISFPELVDFNCKNAYLCMYF